MATPNTAPFDDEAPAITTTTKKSFFHDSALIEPLTLKWEGLSFVVDLGKGERKQILDNLNGTLRPGELTAIMGPSGAGKSSLMNVLSGRAPYGNATGSITVNGAPVNAEKYKTKLAYVMQRDALFATQTARECLNFTAALKLPNSTDDERKTLVTAAISALGLDRCADTLIGSVMSPGLSGGELKRTAVAVELISSPSLIFLDEPTSGLDSHNAYELVKILRNLSEAGCTIVCTIHQPSSEVFDLFHRVMFLHHGQMVFNGPVANVVEHFAAHGHQCKPNYNPADFTMQLLQTVRENELALLMQREQTINRKEESEIDGVFSSPGMWAAKAAPFSTQFKFLLRREFYQLVRDKMTLMSRFGMSCILSLIVGLIFFGAGDEWGNDVDQNVEKEVNNHWGGLVFFTINTMFLSAEPLLLIFPLERPVFIREYITGTYGATAYFLAKTMIDVPVAFFQQLVSLAVAYFLMDLQGEFMYHTLSLTLLATVSGSTALLLGASTTRAETAVNLVPAIYVPQILFAGFFITSDAIPVFMRWIQWVCFLKYGVAMNTIVEFSDRHLPSNNSEAKEVVAKLVKDSNINRDHWWVYVLIMVTAFVCIRLIAAFVLSRRAKKFQ